MNCLECVQLLECELDGGVRRRPEVDSHLARCASCRLQAAELAQLLVGLRALPRVHPPAGMAAALTAAVLHDRRRRRLRRAVTLAAGLAACVLLLMLLNVVLRPASPDLPPQTARENTPKAPPIVSLPEPSPSPRDQPREVPPETTHVAGLGRRLAEQTGHHARVLWMAANPLEDLPVDQLKVPDLNAETQPLLDAGREVADGVQTVTSSTLRAFDFFAREFLPSAN